MSGLGKARGFLYSLGRLLGWVQIVAELLSGHTKRAGKKLANKIIGRKLGSKIYFK
jgi:hypothetical protein